MTNNTKYEDLVCALDNHIAIVEINRPPHNFFDLSLIRQLADLYQELESSDDCRVIILASRGKAFCAGANFNSGDSARRERAPGVNPLYKEAIRLFACHKPSIAVIQGAAVGGGLGLALTADFRIGSAESRFSANFTRLGFHPGFGLSHTLPALVGQQHAAALFYTGKRISGAEALQIGLLDRLVAAPALLEEAKSFAADIALSSPRAVMSIRKTLREGLVDKLRRVVDRESQEQCIQMRGDDFREGVAAMAERRLPRFT